jgi:peptidoglycan hydrolase-like protein with peptidoglycan-binding domain
MRRPIMVVLGITASVALVGGGWLAARAFTSPEQAAAHAAPPSPKPVLAEVTRGDLVDERMLPAAVVPSSQATAVIVPVTGATRSIVTESALAPGAPVAAGTVIVRLNGQPTFAFASSFSFYRDLGLGDSGPDVLALQHNLEDLGLLRAADGSFGAATVKAVGALYRGASASAPRRPDPQPATPANPAETPPAQAQATSSAFLPLSAVITVPSLPARLAEVPAVGADVSSGGTITFAANDAVIRLMVDPALATVLKTGTPVTCRVGADAAAQCHITRVFEATATAAGIGSADQVAMWADVAPDAGAVDASRASERATVSVVVATPASAALLVPASAVAQQGGSVGTVLRQGADGGFRTVKVAVVAALDGTIAVTGDLKVGDLLRVDR